MTASLMAEEAWTDEDKAAADEPRTYVTFILAEQTLAVDVAMVRRILDMQAVTRLPNAPGDLLGMIDISGETVALVDLPGRLGLRGGEPGANRRIIVLEVGADPVTAIGVIADHVLGVVEIPDGEISAAPSARTSWDASVLRGVTR
ncbi:MAG: chemotaxis protein CheW, partial [Pararhodobacter sp.]